MFPVTRPSDQEKSSSLTALAEALIALSFIVLSVVTILAFLHIPILITMWMFINSM